MGRFQAIFQPYAVVLALAGSISGCGDPSETPPPEVRINAAASLAHVIEGLADQARGDLGIRIVVNTAASGTLVQQISQGDQADIFISADTRWMDRLAKRGLIDETSVINLASNRLVLVGRADTRDKPADLSALSDERYQPIAVGDRAYVPVGRYAHQALKAHGLNPGTQLSLAEAPNARAALAFVLSGQCPVGLIYASDALKTPGGSGGSGRGSGRGPGGGPGGGPGVEVLMKIDPDDHDPIRYPAAVLVDAPNPQQAQRVLDWLGGDKAQAAFREAGFGPAR